MCGKKYLKVIKGMPRRGRESKMPTLHKANRELTKTVRFNFFGTL